MKHSPPKWLDKLLSFYCKRERLEDLQGDLHEYFQRNLNAKGPRMARLIYFIDVLKFIRPYTIKKLKIFGIMNFFQLLENYLKTSYRSLARNRLFAGINIIGMGLSLSVGVLMIVYISELMSYDNFHAKGERIYRVLSDYTEADYYDDFMLASTSPLVYQKLQEDYTGLEEVAILRRNYSGDFALGEKVIPLGGYYASDAFFDIFSFDVLHGNAGTALAEPKSIVLTETSAIKFFDRVDVVGEFLNLDEDSYQITAVVADPPANSHMKFEVLVSFSTWVNRMEENDNLDAFYGWSNIWMYHVYMLIDENSSATTIQDHLNQMAEVENAKNDRFTNLLYLEHLSEIVPGKDLSNRIGPGVMMKEIYIILTLTLIVILSSCFNYTNLSIARSLRRAKEVGVRKVVGATGSQVFLQFIVEAVIITLLSLVISLLLFGLLRTAFLDLGITTDGVVNLELKWVYVLYFGLFGLSIGFIAGFLPALVLSKVRSLAALKDASRLKLMQGVNLRKVLIVFQFALSIGFIIAATLSYRQYVYALNFDLGYTTDDIINVDLQRNESKLIAEAFKSVPGVEKVSRSSFVMSSGDIWADEMKYKDPLDSANIYLIYADETYLDLHDFSIIAGTNLPTRPDSTSGDLGVVNERLLKRFDIGTPDEAIGQKLDNGEDGNITIVGVTKDFQHQKIDGGYEPFIFLKEPDNFQFVNLKVKTSDVLGLMTRLEEVWDEFDQVHPFKAEFFNQRLEKAYNEYMITFKIVGFLSILAISVAAMGLLGMAVYTAESRIKEISVRKVLGASERNLIYLLSKGFLTMIGISALVAVPITLYIFENEVFADQVNRIDISWLEIILGVLLIFVIGAVMIGWQTLKAARTNPATTLRDE